MRPFGVITGFHAPLGLYRMGYSKFIPRGRAFLTAVVDIRGHRDTFNSLPICCGEGRVHLRGGEDWR